MGDFVEETGGGGDRLEVAEATGACFTHMSSAENRRQTQSSLTLHGDLSSRILHKYRNSQMLKALT